MEITVPFGAPWLSRFWRVWMPWVEIVKEILGKFGVCFDRGVECVWT